MLEWASCDVLLCANLTGALLCLLHHPIEEVELTGQTELPSTAVLEEGGPQGHYKEQGLIGEKEKSYKSCYTKDLPPVCSVILSYTRGFRGIQAMHARRPSCDILEEGMASHNTYIG